MINIERTRIKDEDVIGKQFGKLTVIGRSGTHVQPNGDKIRLFKCKCECGKITEVRLYHLLNGHTKTCGCGSNRYKTESDPEQYIGQRFGRLTVVAQAPRIVQPSGRARLAYKCLCDCGVEKDVSLDHLLAGDTNSCGCLQKENASAKYLDDLTGKTFGKLTVIERADNRNGATYWKCKCTCGQIKECRAAFLRNGKTCDCGCGSEKSSYPERKLRKYLEQMGYSFVSEYSFEDLKYKNKLRFDFAVFKESKLVCLIEYQGKQHYTDALDDIYKAKEVREITDPMKKEYCKKNNIPLFEIRYDQDLFEAFADIVPEIEFL